MSAVSVLSPVMEVTVAHILSAHVTSSRVGAGSGSVTARAGSQAGVRLYEVSSSGAFSTTPVSCCRIGPRPEISSATCFFFACASASGAVISELSAADGSCGRTPSSALTSPAMCPSTAATSDGFNFFSAFVALSTPSTTDRT
ncbi:hypothetical protein FXN61_09725 [Lentzea sp. PSKA42]|uniref:Secreted protein n=1 Tax=Lentzea indica TaxID=2604800 RepID=A0ABX1FEM0_9PSEU|nr:hypothetical protein [Lentzea indica]NKE57097.1 hypothetical protein [Lentzea indica]